MQLPDETIEYHFQGTLAPPAEAWTPLAELQAERLLPSTRLKALLPQLQTARSQLAAEAPVEDPYAPDAARLHAARARILELSPTRIVPGHGAPFHPGSSTPR